MKDKKLFIIMLVLMQTIILRAQTTKIITLSSETSYTEQLSLKNDDKDMDITVILDFNEEKNTLTVSINASKMIFVFWDDTPYKTTVHHRWLRPEKLTYVVSTHPQDRFRFVKEPRHKYFRPHKNYIFKTWAKAEGMQPVETEKKMVNEYLEQVYNINAKDTVVSIRLRDILLMTEGPQKGMRHDYNFIYGKDLNTKYQITLKRNPCFGQEEEIKIAQNNLDNIRKSYTIFHKKYGRGMVTSQEELNAFNDLRETLLAKYTKENSPSTCPDIQQARNHYNELIDSIQTITVTLQASATDALEVIGGAEGYAINARSILANARLLDNTISQWLITRDDAERSDLDEQCSNIIKDTNVMIGNSSGHTPEEQNAIILFRKAVNYYKKTCK